jgi:uncharacterized membrane protein YesL
MGKFKFVDYNKPGKGVKKESVKEDFSFINFFKIYFRKFWKFCSINLLYILFNFPIFAFFLGMSGNFNIPFKTPAGPMFQQLNSIIMHTGLNPATVALMGFEKNGRLMESSYPGTISQTLMWCGILVVFTFGLANCGMAYILRNFAREEHAYIWNDNISTMKRNFFPAMMLGIVDLAFGRIIVYDIEFFRYNIGSNFMTDVMFWCALLLGIVYLIMRFYMYMILVTFKLSIFKVIKNSFIFSALGLKRNLLGTLGIALIVIIDWYLLKIFTPMGLILPIIALYGICAYIGSYCSWPKIKQYMVYPYETEEAPAEQPVFTDDVL